MRSRAVRDKVLKRDGMCVVCGIPYGLDVHHVESFGAHGDDDPSKMVTLCRYHHMKWHDGDEGVRRAVREYLEKVNNPEWLTGYSPALLIDWGRVGILKAHF